MGKFFWPMNSTVRCFRESPATNAVWSHDRLHVTSFARALICHQALNLYADAGKGLANLLDFRECEPDGLRHRALQLP